jgi:putative flippase GtrA
MIITFILNISFSYLVAYGIAKPVMNYLLKDNSLKLKENMALFTGMCLFTVINYIGQRLVVFNENFTGKNHD